MAACPASRSPPAGIATGDAGDRIVYTGANDQILFDADGSPAGALDHFAMGNAGTALGASDFTLIWRGAGDPAYLPFPHYAPIGALLGRN